MSSHTEQPDLACNLDALTPEQRAHHTTQSPLLFASVMEARALPDGYAFRLPDTPDILARIADFMAHERLCCPFFQFGLTVEQYGSAIWVTLSGPQGVKELIEAEMGGYLPKDVALTAGLRS